MRLKHIRRVYLRVKLDLPEYNLTKDPKVLLSLCSGDDVEIIEDKIIG